MKMCESRGITSITSGRTPALSATVLGHVPFMTGTCGELALPVPTGTGWGLPAVSLRQVRCTSWGWEEEVAQKQRRERSASVFLATTHLQHEIVEPDDGNKVSSPSDATVHLLSVIRMPLGCIIASSKPPASAQAHQGS